MKKRTIAIFIIIALATIYMGLSWITGKLIAHKIDNTIYQIDQFLNNHQKFIKFESTYRNYHTGLFSTTFNLKITVTSNSRSVSDNSPNAPSILFNDKITIYHGPFPWSELKIFRLYPKMAGITYEMSKKASPKLWTLTNCKPYLTAKMSIGYDQDLKLKLFSLPINKINLIDTSIYNISKGLLILNIKNNFSEFDMNLHFKHLKIKDPQLNIDLSELNMGATSLPVQGDNLSYKLSSSLAKASISRQESPHNKEIINLNNINYHTTLNNHFDSGFSNANKLAIDTIYLHDNAKKIHINDVKIINQNRSKNNATVFGLVDYKVGNISVGNQNFGFGNAQISYENLPVASLNLLANYFVKKKAYSYESEPIKLSLDKLYWENTHGVMEMKLSALLRNITFNDKHSFTDINQNNVNKLDFSLKIPLKTLTYFLAQASNTAATKISQDNMQDAYRNTLLLATLLRNSPTLQIIMPQHYDQKYTPGIYSTLHYDANKPNAVINGQLLPAKHFFKKLKLFN